MFDNKKAIEKEDWKKAEGVEFTGNQTNSVLTKRDYSIKCRTPHRIAYVKGYNIWWCSVHHQPERLCQIGRIQELIDDNALVMLKIDKDTLLDGVVKPE